MIRTRPTASLRRLATAIATAAFLALAAAADETVPLGLRCFDEVWQVVAESHFDPDFGGTDWNAARERHRPRAAAARETEELRRVLQDLLNELRESHFYIVPGSSAPQDPPHEEPASDRSAGDTPGPAASLPAPSTATDPDNLPLDTADGQPGFECRLTNDTLVVFRVTPGSDAHHAGLHPGSEVLTIDGHATGEFLDSLPSQLSAARKALQAAHWAADTASGPAGTPVHVEIRSPNGRPIHHAILREPRPGESAALGSMPGLPTQIISRPLQTQDGLNIGLIGFNVWMAPVLEGFNRAIDQWRDADGIIIDIRGNPGGIAALIMRFAGHFVESRELLGTMIMRDNRLSFHAFPQRLDSAGRRTRPFDGPLAILVDAGSASASELFAGGLQALGRARVFGQTTSGSALPALFHRLPNDDVLVHAVGDFVTGNGQRIEGRGVRPDVMVPLRPAELSAGIDATLEAALRWIDGLEGRRPQGP